ncbi:hypothetical protein CROQUDRAFT_39224 [Cronartium quercuum f. sp. fusiforme G11]|uniref:DUF7872 domain-containing protein n=1 Tax=Cronartium quercuum f. sp. fusiforme G11 TaxID=708437 RepID=A0A9P6NME6_9BASI|nr:hypothetical protein CROQUDRAFT_39224 [Cronartium quercuum f. sp. fusiforme G11]
MAHLLAVLALTLPTIAFAGRPGLGPSAHRPDFPVQTHNIFTLTIPTALLTNASHTNHTIEPPRSNHTTSSVNVTIPQLNDECLRQPLTPELWHKLKMNAYLDSYPGGKNWTLEKYAGRVGATDFVCGIGKVCSPGQLCESVKGRDWYALVAAENWNNFVNSLFEAAGDAFDEVSAILPTMVPDYFSSTSHRHGKRSYPYTSTHSNAFPASLFSSIAPIEGSIWGSWGTISWIGLVMAIYQVSAFSWVNTLLIVGNGESRFIRSSDVTWMLGEAQHAVQETISNITQQVITAGISTSQGLASINRDGIFLTGVPIINQNTVQKEFERTLKVKTLVKLWRIQNVFIVRGSDPCTGSGPNGALDKPGVLSYCGTDGVSGSATLRHSMMNIVRADLRGGNKFYDTLYHGHLAEAKYGFTTEFLTTQSWECQKEHGVFEYDPFVNRTAISYVNPHQPTECLVNLPVCDATNPAIIVARKRGQSLTKVCRDIANLPI